MVAMEEAMEAAMEVTAAVTEGATEATTADSLHPAVEIHPPMVGTRLLAAATLR